MRRILIAFALAAGLLVSPAAADSPLPIALRSAGVTQQQWDALQSEVRSTAARASVSERALAAVAERLGLAMAEGGRRVDVGEILTQLSALAARITELETRLAALARDEDGAVATLIDQARSAINAGDLSTADAALADARRTRAERNALRRAELDAGLLEEAAIVAAQGEVASLRADYLAAAAFYAEAAELAPEGARERWLYRQEQGWSLREHGVRFDAAYLRESLRVYESLVLPLASRGTHPEDWAKSQGNLAIVLTEHGERNFDRQSLNRAVVALQDVASVWTREGHPTEWVTTQNALALAYLALSNQGDGQAASQALAAFDAALSAATRAADPALWAGLQSNRGLALRQAGDAERAVAAFEAALTVFTRDANPGGWLAAQTNLGLALHDLGERGVPGAFERALAAYDAVLAVFQPEADPAIWANVQFARGTTLIWVGQQGTPGALEAGAAAFQAGLAAVTRESAPNLWAMGQASLGATLQIMGENGDRDAMTRAAAAYEAALTVSTRTAAPAEWADTTYNLAYVYASLGRFAAARTAARGAIEVFEQTGDGESAAHLRQLLADMPSE